MPSDLSYWIISAPLKDGDPGIMLMDARNALGDSVEVGQWEIPELKTGTLSQLLSLSDMLPKLDSQFTATVSKTLDTLRSLTDDGRLSRHARINDRPVDEALMQWKWDRGRWGEGGKVAEVIDALTKEMNSIDSIQKQRTQSYNLVKGNMTNLQRKRTGNLSQRSLLEVVKKEDLVQDSEFMETLVVAVPKNSVKDWEAKYERLTSMVVPRSSQQVAADDDFSLRTVTVFKKVRDEFTHRCRENKFIVRDFHYEDSALEKQKKELSELEAEEKELWSDLLKLTRINFSESYQILAHLKTVRLFVESALRYGLPAEYAGVIVRPEPKTAVNILKTLSSHYSYLSSASQGPSSRKNKKSGGVTAGSEEVGGEWQSVMEAEFYDFVLFEIPKVDFQG